MTVRTYVALGSNWGDSISIVSQAADVIASLGSQVRISSLYRSAPAGSIAQPWYVNAVVGVDTMWPPETLLQRLWAVERRFGRWRHVHWGPRLLDCDLLLYGDWVVDQPGHLVIPHPRMSARRFVLEPLVEIAPEIQLSQGIRARDLLSQVQDQEVERLCRH